MIVKGLFDLVYNLLDLVLTPFEIIPDVPNQVSYVVSQFLDFIFAPVRILAFFLPGGTFISVVIPVFLVIINMEHIWTGILWILKKLPFVGIE